MQNSEPRVIGTLKLLAKVDGALQTIAFVENKPKSDIIGLFVSQWLSRVKGAEISDDEDGMILRTFAVSVALSDSLRKKARKSKCTESALIRACVSRGITSYRRKKRL